MIEKRQRQLLMIAVAILLLNTFIDYKLQAQKVSIRITDIQTNLPIHFATVTLEDPSGIHKPVNFSVDSGIWYPQLSFTVIARIHCLGYLPQSDTLIPQVSKTILMTTDPLSVNEVVVTGQYNAVTIDKSIYTIHVINHQQIKDRAANTLGDLLSEETAFRISQDAVLGSNINIQGITGENVKILVDGVPITGRQNGFIDLNHLLLSNVDHIEIIEGPMSVIYGSNALAGAINIITKDNAKSHIGWSGQLNSYLESVGIANIDGMLIYRKNHSSITINAGRYFFGGYSPMDTSRVKAWKPKLQYFGSANYNFANSKNIFTLSGSLFREELQNKGDTFNYIHAFDTYYYTQRMNIHSDFLHKTGEKAMLQLTAAYATYSKEKLTKQIDFTDLTSIIVSDSTKQDTTRFTNWLARATYSGTGSTWMHFQTGLDLTREGIDGHRTIGKKTITENAAFLSFTLLPIVNVNIQGGLRVIQNSKYTAPVIYSVHLKYNPSPLLIFRISYGKGFRSPSLNELYLNFVDINHDVHGNDSLKAETSNNINIGTTYTLKTGFTKFSLNMNGFYNQFQHKIDFLYDFYTPGRAQYYNIPDENFITRGVELNMGLLFRSGLSLNSGYYFLQRSHVPESSKFYHSHDVTLSAKYPIPLVNIRLTIFYKYTDTWIANSIKKDNINNVLQTFPMKMNGFSTMNIIIQRSFLKGRLESTTGIKNIFNVKDVYSSGSGDNIHSGGSGNTAQVGWGRTVFFGLNLNF